MASAVAEAQDASTTPSRLDELAGHPSARVRDAVAMNLSTGDATLLVLAQDEKATVRGAAAIRGGSRPALEADLAASSDKWVRAILAHTYAVVPRRQLQRTTQEVLTVDAFREVRQRVAETTAHRDLYDRLLEDPNPGVRGSCGLNPRTTRADMDRLLDDRQAATRGKAVEGGVAFPDEEQLLRAVRDRSMEVRWAALFRPGAPRSVALALVDDPEEVVSQHARIAVINRGDIWSPRGEAQAVAERAQLASAGLTFDGGRTD